MAWYVTVEGAAFLNGHSLDQRAVGIILVYVPIWIRAGDIRAVKCEVISVGGMGNERDVVGSK